MSRFYQEINAKIEYFRRRREFENQGTLCRVILETAVRQLRFYSLGLLHI